MVWGVFTQTGAGPGFLAGDYVGASGEATLGAGLGGNVPTGPSRCSRSRWADKAGSISRLASRLFIWGYRGAAPSTRMRLNFRCRLRPRRICGVLGHAQKKSARPDERGPRFLVVAGVAEIAQPATDRFHLGIGLRRAVQQNSLARNFGRLLTRRYHTAETSY